MRYIAPIFPGHVVVMVTEPPSAVAHVYNVITGELVDSCTCDAMPLVRP